MLNGFSFSTNHLSMLIESMINGIRLCICLISENAVVVIMVYVFIIFDNLFQDVHKPANSKDYFYDRNNMVLYVLPFSSIHNIH